VKSERIATYYLESRANWQLADKPLSEVAVLGGE
jgi:hypothetical protein